MMFLVSITLVLITVLITVAVSINEFSDGEMIQDNFLILLPVETYNKNLFYFAAGINLFCSSFFVLPVL
jgi:hypothetical protein